VVRDVAEPAAVEVAEGLLDFARAVHHERAPIATG
jgi:hypothetical protein